MYWPIGPAKAYTQHLPFDIDIEATYDGLDLSRRARQKARSARQNKSVSGIGSLTLDDLKPARHSLSGPRTATASSTATARGNPSDDGSILDIGVFRHGRRFATITRTSLSVWSVKPTVILTSIIRSRKSLETYGDNVGLLLRPDADVLIIRSSLGYLIVYALDVDPDGRVYSFSFAHETKHARRRSSAINSSLYGSVDSGPLLDTIGEATEARLRFQMVLRLEGELSMALALDGEIIAVTTQPSAVQCVRLSQGRSGAQSSEILLSSMPWFDSTAKLLDVIHDRAMNIFAFISDTGQVYAVQKLSSSTGNADGGMDLSFSGHLFHAPDGHQDFASKAAINSRFSLIAVGCKDGSVQIYAVTNYAGDIRHLRSLEIPVPSHARGSMTTLCYSPDGYCLFAGFEHGWMTWSVFGQPGATSFGRDATLSETSGDRWLSEVQNALWVGAGSGLLILPSRSSLIWSVEFARSAVTSCFNPANTFNGLLQTSTGLIVYLGNQINNLMSIIPDNAFWQDIEIPTQYQKEQWPLRMSVISPDLRYIAIAGQHGLAHYSLQSGRWRTFSDRDEQNDFLVRGGMCWYQHFLIAAVDTRAGTYELRLYSRETNLENRRVLDVVALEAPAVNVSVSGDGGILVYTYDNTLDHFILDTSRKPIKFLKLGRIVLKGIIRAPQRVRAISWVLPDSANAGDGRQKVSLASIFFLVDGNLSLLQPSTTEGGGLKYGLCTIAQQVEYFILTRDDASRYNDLLSMRAEGLPIASQSNLKDSLWVFEGQNVKLWPDVQQLLTSTATELNPSDAVGNLCVSITSEFYPFTVAMDKGIVMGAEAELAQLRDGKLAYFKTTARTTLFLPELLRYHLGRRDIATAIRICRQFERLSYLSHALELLLHTVLDEEAERPDPPIPESQKHLPEPRSQGSSKTSSPARLNTNLSSTSPSLSDTPETKSQSDPQEMHTSLLPTILSFLSTFPDHLDIILRCTRKTELRTWSVLFAHLPPPIELFEAAIEAGNLKTAGGYLLILHQHYDHRPSTSSEFPDYFSSSPYLPSSGESSSDVQAEAQAQAQAQVIIPQAVKLLELAQGAEDWDLCGELARFLMALDQSGDTLRRALKFDVDDGDRDDAAGNGKGEDIDEEEEAPETPRGSIATVRKTRHARGGSSSTSSQESDDDGGEEQEDEGEEVEFNDLVSSPGPD